jgi:hypothetical protein
MNLLQILSVVVLGALISVVLVANWRMRRKIRVLRASGIFPEEGKESEADIARLKQAGETVLAVRCYRILHRVGLREAHDAVIGCKSSAVDERSIIYICIFIIAIGVFVSFL